MRSNLLLGLAGAILLLAQPVLATPSEDMAIAARPAFELPFPCEEEWQGATYSGHGGGNHYPLDFNQGAGDDDLGETVVASAAGEVSVRTEGDGDHVVVVNHGGGWTSEYRHMGTRTRTSGHVDRGDQVGTVGKESHPPVSPHLHYEQKLNGVAQPIYFHGVAAPYSFVYNGPTFTSHNECLGQTPTASAGVTTISRGVGLMDVFATGSDGVVKHRAWVRDHWEPASGWRSLNGGMTTKVIGEPAAVSAVPGRIDLFARGADNRLKHLVWTTAAEWGQWRSVDGSINASPAAISRSETGVDVFARNSANQVVWRHLNTTTNTWPLGWGGLHTKAVSSGPAAVASVDGSRMNIFARDTDGSLLSLMWTSDHGWWNWADRGGSFVGRPAATTRENYEVDVFLRAGDNNLLHWHSPNGSDWTTYKPIPLGGAIFSAPAAVSQHSQRLDVFARNNNGQLVQRIWSKLNVPDGWYPWVGVGAIP